MTNSNPWNNDAMITHVPTIDAIAGVFNNIFGAVNNGISNATTGNGIFSGNYDSLNTGVQRAVGLLPHAFSMAGNDYLTNMGAGAGNALTSIFGSVSMQPSFYLVAIGGILGLGIVLYILMKV